jgi:hypothetical protein
MVVRVFVMPILWLVNFGEPVGTEATLIHGLVQIEGWPYFKPIVTLAGGSLGKLACPLLAPVGARRLRGGDAVGRRDQHL